MRRDTELVKKPPEAPEKPAPRGDFRRHLQGYELGLLTVGMVLTFALLVLPRASEPNTLPLPRVDHAEERRSAASERALSAEAEAQGLPFEVRAVGESIRHFGHSVSLGIDTGHDRDDIRERVRAVLAKGQGPLMVRLRAVQTQYFLRALEQFEHSGAPSADLDELGADFVTHAKQNGWLSRAGNCSMSEAVRRVLFHMHWAELIEARSVFPFAPSLNDWRTYYGFLLACPEPDPTLIGGGGAEDTARLRVVTALSKKDPDYPEFFGKGCLFYRLGERDAAATAFRTQLGLHESGPYSLLARNYLIYTLQGAESE